MSWPVKFDDPTAEALVLVPSPGALVQDLGAFRTGRLMETDLLPRSALLCAAEDGKPVISESGTIRFAFEGNANGAVNLERFYERCLCAAGRLATRAPNIAYGQAPASELLPVARYDLLRYVFTEIIDAEALEAWSGEDIASYLPPRELPTPTADPEVTNPLCRLPMNGINRGQNDIYAWSLMDGTILTKAWPDGDLVAWRPGDEGLGQILERAGLPLSERMKFESGGALPIKAS